MREESHLDEMRDAIRGDFERLAERRGDQDLMRAPPPEDPPAASDPEPSAEPEPEAEIVDDEAEQRSWLARLFSA